jgi:hypothetical protein
MKGVPGPRLETGTLVAQSSLNLRREYSLSSASSNSLHGKSDDDRFHDEV